MICQSVISAPNPCIPGFRNVQSNAPTKRTIQNERYIEYEKAFIYILGKRTSNR